MNNKLLRWEFGRLQIIKLFNKYRGHLDFKICRNEGEEFEDMIERGASEKEIIDNYWKIRNGALGLIRWDKYLNTYKIKIADELLKNQITKEEYNFIIKTTIEINKLQETKLFCKNCGDELGERLKDVWAKKFIESGLCYYCFRIKESEIDPESTKFLPIEQYKKDREKRRIQNNWKNEK